MFLSLFDNSFCFSLDDALDRVGLGLTGLLGFGDEDGFVAVGIGLG